MGDLQLESGDRKAATILFSSRARGGNSQKQLAWAGAEDLFRQDRLEGTNGLWTFA